MPSSTREPGRSLLGRLGPRGGRLGLIAAIAGAVVILDQASKALATHYLAGHQPTELLGGLIRLDYYRNFAGPNNIFPGHTEAISLFGILAVIVLLAIGYRVVTMLSAVVVGLMLGGAIGNLLDRLLREPGPLRGGVVDWLRLTDRTKSMNVADLAIDAAIAVMLVGAVVLWWRERGEGEADRPRENGAATP
ncbi:MAG TPA: signal peptidase II [Solirubrobacterales bacterium]